jgi:hypothetical protein
LDFVRHALLPREELQRMVQPLAEAQQHLGCDFSSCAVWCPAEETAIRLEYARRLQATDPIINLIRRSLNSECYTLHDTYRGTIGPWQIPQSYLEARAHLELCLADPQASPERVAAALEMFESRLQAEIIGPLQQEAMQGENLIRRALLMELANTSALLQSLGLFMRCHSVRSLLDAGSRAERDQLDRNWKRMTLMMDRLLRLARELSR